MPELPEVETVRSQLQKFLIGKKINLVKFTPGRITGDNKNFGKIIQGRKITGIDRHGKLLTFSTDDTDMFLLGHLKMTGQLIFVDKNGMAGGGHTLSAKDLDLPHKHTHVSFHFADGSKLYFNDMRKFGFLRIATKKEAEEEQSKYGIEPISKDFNFEYLKSVLSGRKTTIKGLLLQQKQIAGLGNIYVDEACFMAAIRPDRIASSLSDQEIKLLAKACRRVLQQAIKAGGTTFYDFTNAKGEPGHYIRQLNVFQKQGQPCGRCDGIIKKIKVAGRGTHFCPVCQF